MSIEDLEFLENFFKTVDILEANKKLGATVDIDGNVLTMELAEWYNNLDDF